MLQVLPLSVALAADAMAVTASISGAESGRALVWRAALVFGVFQAGMAALGAVGGVWLSTLVGAGLSWVACVVLVALGLRMIVGADDEDTDAELSWTALLALGVATSVDALAAGVSLPAFSTPIWVSVLSIGGVTTALSAGAGLGGHLLGERFGLVVQRLGGAVLILLGVSAVWGLE
ncbi:MAG: manganese efflux pump [Myxococcota bacterium]|nr:manganese efflux pump [Myxococcota bacterium]